MTGPTPYIHFPGTALEAAGAPLPPDGADGRLTQLGTGPVMMPPAPTAPPLRGLPLNARIIVSPLGTLPLISTETERCPFCPTLDLTDTPGCGAG